MLAVLIIPDGVWTFCGKPSVRFVVVVRSDVRPNTRLCAPLSRTFARGSAAVPLIPPHYQEQRSFAP